MSDQNIIAELKTLRIQELVRTPRECGRAALSENFKSFWSKQHALASNVLDDDVRGYRARRLAALLKDITYSTSMLARNPLPTYYCYSDVTVLDWFIGKRQNTFPFIKKKCLEGITYMLLDLLRFESDSRVGIAVSPTESYDHSQFPERVEAIKDAISACQTWARLTGAHLDASQDLVHYSDLEEYVEEGSRLSALIHFTGIPQTTYHDEVLFLRTICISELCFYAIRTLCIEATENLKCGGVQVAERSLEEATVFADLLHRTFKILRTMPPPSFANFRKATGNASAVQSMNYHMMDVHFRGIHPDKREVFGRTEHLKPLLYFDGVVHLGMALETYSHDKNGLLMERARELDRKLLTWRGLHLGFAKAYLPAAAPGTGATEGAPYLKKFLFAGLFDDTVVDVQIVKDMFPELPELPDLFSVPASVGIAPDEVVRSRSEETIRRRSLKRKEGSGTLSFGLSYLTRVDVQSLVGVVERLRGEAPSSIARSEKTIRENIDAYAAHFKSAGHKCPLPKQFERILKDGLPRTQPFVDALILFEMTHGLLMGIQDADAISGDIIYDVAKSGEEFAGRRGSILCRAGEVVLRDQEGIIASYFQGPDEKTSLKDSSRNLVLYVFDAPGIGREKVENTLREATAALASVAESTATHVV